MFKIAYNDSAVQRFNHYTTRTPSHKEPDHNVNSGNFMLPRTGAYPMNSIKCQILRHPFLLGLTLFKKYIQLILIPAGEERNRSKVFLTYSTIPFQGGSGNNRIKGITSFSQEAKNRSHIGGCNLVSNHGNPFLLFCEYSRFILWPSNSTGENI